MLRLVSVLVCLGALEVASEPTTITLPLTDVLENGLQTFVGEITIGTPAQPMSVAVHIGGLLGVPSVKCSDPFCMNHQQYDSSASSTYEEDGTPFELPYNQNISGVLSKDAFGIADVTVTDQIFGEATAVWNTWNQEAPNDGVLGLGFYEAVPSILDTMADQGLIAERTIGLWLGRDGAGGELTLGGVNDDRYSGDLTWAPVVDDLVVADSVSIGEMVLCASDCLMGAYSVTPYFYMPMEAAKAINDALGGIDIGQPGVAALECDTLDTLPSLKIEIPGRTLEMSAQEYTFILPELCISGFVGGPDVPDGVVAAGTLFMQKFYTIYDMENMRVGVADSA